MVVRGRLLPRVKRSNDILRRLLSEPYQISAFNHVRTALPGHSAFEAALSAGHTRIRPVLMTAAAMIVGMIPMAIGGAGEEQNAALARAVIGGLMFATPTTLLVVPWLFAKLRSGNDGKPSHGVFEEEVT